MRYKSVFVFFLVGFLIQSTLILNFSIMGVTPNLMLCLTILFSFLYKGNQGLIFGIIFGLVQDVNSSILTGPSAIIYFFIALLMSEIRHYLYRDSPLNIFFASAIGTAVYYPASWLILMIFKGNYSFLFMMKSLPMLFILHFIVMILFYLLVGKRSIRHPSDRYYKGGKIYNIN